MIYFPDPTKLIKYLIKRKIFYVDENILVSHFDQPHKEIIDVVDLFIPILHEPALYNYLNNILLEKRLKPNEYVKEIYRQIIAQSSPKDQLKALNYLSTMELQETKSTKDIKELLRSKIYALLYSSNKQDNITAINIIMKANENTPEVADLVQSIKDILSGAKDD